MKILRFLKNIFQLSKTQNLKYLEALEETLPQSLPKLIANEENIARFIFSPINVNPKNNNLKINCLKPPTGFDEVSVNRFDFTDATFLKTIGLEMQKPKKEFYGLATCKAKTIRENNFDVIYTPIEESNIFHSDIKIGYTVEKDIELPAEISLQIRNVLKKTKLFIDTDASTNSWVGDEIKL